MATSDSTSSLQASKSKAKRPWGWFALLAISIVIAAIANAYFWIERRPLPEGGDLEAPSGLSFAGPSEELKGTILVPTLERPIPAGKSAIWCATMPMAWQELEKSVAKGPVDIQGAEAICRELRNTPDPELEPRDYYVAAGLQKDAIVKRIRGDLAERFPNAPLKWLPPVQSEGAVAFAYLEVSLFYEFFFKHSDQPLHFKDSASRQTAVHAFGFRETNENDRARRQVVVLFREKGEFALDLSRNTRPYQIILARMDRKPSLKETLDDLEKRTTGVEPHYLSDAAILQIPTMHWQVEHRYRELEKPSANFPQPIEAASQAIRFKMDRKGAYVASAASLIVLPNGHERDLNPNHYIFDRPYLIVMKKRGIRQPLLVMWIDNAELLQRR